MTADRMPSAADRGGEIPWAMPQATSARPGFVLSLSDCSLSSGTIVGRLRRTSAAVLATLAARHPAPVGARDLAELLAIRSGVDPISAARAAVTLLRSELRVLGLAHLVRSRRGFGYWLEERHELRVVGSFPGPRTPVAVPQAGTGPRSLPSLLDAVDTLADAELDRVGSTVMLPCGILDLEDRSLSIAGHRVGFGSERDFNLLATTALACGKPVEEQLLMRLCGFAEGPFSAEILRRTVRQLNAVLHRRGVPLAIEPVAKPYGSPYRLAEAGPPNATKPQSNRHAPGMPGV